MSTTRIIQTVRTARRAGLTAGAVVGATLVLAAGVASGGRPDDLGSAGRPGDGAVGRYTVRHLEADLARPCQVTGCDPAPLAAIHGTGLPAMTADELAEAERLAGRVADASAAAAREAAAGDARVHERLAALAAADAAVARLHAGERVRRAAAGAS